MIIPLFNSGAKVEKCFHDNPQANINSKPLKRRFPPGSPWLSVKIYSGNSAVDNLMGGQLLKLIEAFSSLYKKWFFIRYADPDWHLRLRFYGDPHILYSQLLPKLNLLLDPMIESGEIHKIELFTYEREVERYGGSEAMPLIEKLFMFDSFLVAKTIELESTIEEDIRWRVVILISNQLLIEFGYSTLGKLSLISRLRSGFGREFNESRRLRKQIGQKFKNIKSTLWNDLSIDKLKQLPPEIGRLFEQWKRDVIPVIREINIIVDSGRLSCDKDTLLSSILHMHNNRMFKAYGREHELIMHDFLRRYYLFCSKVK